MTRNDTTSKTEPRTVSLTVKRGTNADDTRMETFTLPYSPGMSVLDALISIQRTIDSSLAFRYSCINANACKECSVTVDGEVTYACTARLTEAGAVVEPLAGKRLIRDLVTDTIPTKEHLAKVLETRG